jgi:two-component system alkaline phosphatase synthesis response regulator PhoP
MDKYLIYSVEDDADIAHILQATLAKQGYDVLSFPDGESFLKAFYERKPNMVLLDLMLPGIQGKDLLKTIRGDKANDEIQIIIISARTLTIDKVDGLDLGADDYIEKPFDLLELMSRINAHVRRNKKSETISIGPYVLDMTAKELRKSGIGVDLTPSEFLVVRLLFEKEGSVVTRSELAEELYGDANKADSRTLDMHIKSIRQKIGDKDQSFIVSVYGSGYKISA